MKVIYTKYSGEDPDTMSLEALIDSLANFLLQSGFGAGYYETDLNDPSHGQTLEALYDAIAETLMDSGLLPRDADLGPIVERLLERLMEEGYLAPSEQDSGLWREGKAGRRRPKRADWYRARFELTEKSIDFLGFRALRHLLASLGKSSFGRHETQALATGVEATLAAKRYEFGDTLNLDLTQSLLHAIGRTGARVPIDLDYEDLFVHQTEYQSSCATAVLLDCSHSMVLYGEDRFTPAKCVAIALSHLLRTQYPGDSLHLVVFHDSAEEVPLSRLAQVRVGPYYTNTREGLRLAQRLLARQRKDMKQIVMITDGKPSALTLQDGSILRNPFGLDPYIVSETLSQVIACRKSGIIINTFMLAREPDLVEFVRQIAEICHGKAYFTTPSTLGQYILMDFLNRKSRRVH